MSVEKLPPVKRLEDKVALLNEIIDTQDKLFKIQEEKITLLKELIQNLEDTIEIYTKVNLPKDIKDE